MFDHGDCLVMTIKEIVWQERQYKPLPTIDQLAIHFSMDGNMIHIDSDEAKRQFQHKGNADGLSKLMI